MENGSRKGKRIGGAGIYDLKTETFDFPTRNDPDYYVSLDQLEGHEGLLLEVCHWRDDKGVSAQQIVKLFEEAAGVLC